MAYGSPDVGRAKGVKRVINACKYSWTGIVTSYKHEAAFRQEVWVIVPLVFVSFFVAGNHLEWLLLSTSLLVILIIELVNTGIENAIDRFGSQKHELSARAKDAGSAAVMLSIVLACIIWFSIIVF